MTIEIPAEAFASGLLQEGKHDRLVAELDQVVRVANIPSHMVWSKLSDYCIGTDYEWVKDMLVSDDYGLAYVGKFKQVSQVDRMLSITGACLRNFKDARLYTVQEVISKLKNDTLGYPSILLIPNFCIGSKDGGDIPSWEVSNLLGMLYARTARGLKTIVYVSSLSVLESNYGEAFKQHIEHHFHICTE